MEDEKAPDLWWPISILSVTLYSLSPLNLKDDSSFEAGGLAGN